MATTLATPRTTSRDPLVTTARTTGLLYLALGVTGMLGFLLVRPAVFAVDDPSATLRTLVDSEQLARAGIALELGIVLTQVLVALWFYRLFRAVDGFAAGAIAVFGAVNAVAVLVSAALLATALDAALEPALGSGADSHVMLLASENLWGVGNLFFGLWLIPMGWCVLRSRWMPWPLGWLLVAGGVGYVLSGLARYLVPDADVLFSALTVPASVGEFWVIGYLLVRGVRRPVPAGTDDGRPDLGSPDPIP